MDDGVYNCQHMRARRGWRRSGRWMYTPVHEKTCCQLLTIRLDVNEFEMNRAQRKVKKRWEAYLNGHGDADNSKKGEIEHDWMENGATTGGGEQQDEEYDGVVVGQSPKRPRDDDHNDNDGHQPRQPEAEDIQSRYDGVKRGVSERAMIGATKRQRSVVDFHVLDEDGNESPTVKLSERLQEAFKSPVLTDGKSKVQILCGDVEKAVSQALELCIDAGQLPRLEYPAVKVKPANAKQQKMHGMSLLFAVPISHAIAAVVQKVCQTNEDLVYEGMSSAVQVAQSLAREMHVEGCRVKADKGFINVYRDNVDNDHYRAEEMFAPKIELFGETPKPSRIQSDRPDSKPVKSEREPRKFNMVMVDASDPSIVEVEFDLFKKYQTQHHHDEPESVTRESFIRFLCDSPLVSEPASCDRGIPAPGYGSFHQQYWVDGKLIAVGVVDILPRCLSSKYFFWDPDLAKLSLGTLASLLEIEWVKQSQTYARNFRYYYLGYYLHDCHRMRYKANFAPSQLLCPKTFAWVPISKVKAALESRHKPPELSKYVELVHINEKSLTRTDAQKNVLGSANDDGNVDHDDASVQSVLLFVSFEGSHASHRRKGKAISFGALCAIGAIQSKQAQEHLERRLRRWKQVVGPAWRKILYAV